MPCMALIAAALSDEDVLVRGAMPPQPTGRLIGHASETNVTHATNLGVVASLRSGETFVDQAPFELVSVVYHRCERRVSR